MQCLHRIIVLITLVSYRATSDEMIKKTYRLAIKPQSDSEYAKYRDCQECLLNSAGVQGFSIMESQKSAVKLVLTASYVSHVRIQTHCNHVGHCADLIRMTPRASPEISPKESAESITRIIEKIGMNELEEKVVCLAQKHIHVEERCRVCLRETSDSKSMGEFLFRDLQDDYFVYILRTSHQKHITAKACMDSRSCREVLADKYSDELCEVMHSEGVSTYYGESGIIVKDQAGITGEARQSDNKHEQNVRKLHCALATPLESTSEERGDTNNSMLPCLNCLARQTNLFVHWMRVSTESRSNAYFLFGKIGETSNSQFPDACAGICTILDVPTNECYKKYHKQFDTTPIGDQVSTFIALVEPKNIKLDYYSDCVVTYNEPGGYGNCLACIQEFFDDRAPVVISDITSLFPVKDIEKLRLAACVSNFNVQTCNRFLFVPNEICWTYGSSEQVVAPARMLSAGSGNRTSISSLISKQDKTGRRSLKSMAKRTPSGSALVAARTDFRQMVLNTLERASAKNIRSVHRQPPRVKVGSSHYTVAIEDDAPSSDMQFSLLLVKYSDKNCLFCLALKREILVMLPRRNLIWMKNSIIAPRCPCQLKTVWGINIDNFHSMRPIPANDLRKYLGPERR